MRGQRGMENNGEPNEAKKTMKGTKKQWEINRNEKNNRRTKNNRRPKRNEEIMEDLKT